jgi:hypothetical protein
MKDSMGRGFWERRREASFEHSHESDNERREELKKAFQSKSGANIAELRKFASVKAVIRAMLPQLLVGGVLAFVEYHLVGPLYTILSIIIYVPLIYLYSRTLRTRNGVYIMVPTSDIMDWERLFVSEEIWSLVEKKTGMTLEDGKINGRITYWCTAVKYLEGSNIPWYVEIAWKHYNRAKYGMFESVLDDLTAMLKDAMLEVAKLKKTGDVMAITEGTRQSRELIDAITSAHKDSIMNVLRKEKLSQEESQIYEDEINELLQNPEYLQALIKKKNEESKKEDGDAQ